MTQTRPDNHMQTVGHFTTFQLVGTPPRNGFDAHMGEWVVWENGSTVALLPTLEAVKEWAATQLTPIQRMARELVIQDYWEPSDWDEADRGEAAKLFAEDANRQERYERRAERLLEAFRAGPDSNPGTEGLWD